MNTVMNDEFSNEFKIFPAIRTLAKTNVQLAGKLKKKKKKKKFP